MKNNRWIMMLMALIAGFLIISAVPATTFAQESENGFFDFDNDVTGAYDEDYSDNWWYDTYSYEEETGDEVFGYYGDEDDWGWYDNDYYSGYYNDTWDDDDWYYDTYDDTEDEGFWDF